MEKIKIKDTHTKRVCGYCTITGVPYVTRVFVPVVGIRLGSGDSHGPCNRGVLHVRQNDRSSRRTRTAAMPTGGSAPKTY